MSLRTKLAVGLVTIAAILLVPLVMAVVSLANLEGNARELRDREFAASFILNRIAEGINAVETAESSVLFADDTSKAAAQALMMSHIKTVGALTDTLQQLQLVDAARDLRAAVSQITEWAPIEAREALAGNGKAADSIARGRIRPALELASASIAAGETQLRDRTTVRVSEAVAGIKRTRIAALGGMLLALLVAAAIAFLFTRSITGPVKALEKGMSAVAEGDFTVQLKFSKDRTDEFGLLATSFDSMTRQLHELDKLKAEFVSVASHELKTPVNVIVGYLQLLEEGIYGPLTEKQLQVHKTLESQAQSLLRLTRQLLDVSRFEAGGGRLDIRKIALDHFFEELERSFHVLAVQREIQFGVALDPNTPNEVYWDQDRMNEVLGNLLSNAFKFTDRGGSVDLKCRPQNGLIEMTVTDTGAGIPPEQVPRIFDKFYQADTPAAAKSLGSGLGLAIAKQIVEAHAGTISCVSAIGVGTTFTIRLPARAVRRSSIRVKAPLGET
jgi:signal transduction histidine kinase